MEKKKPTYDLESFKAVATSVGVTGTAFRDARSLGYNRAGISKVIGSMQRRHFYKSMTSHADHRVWQDVYHVPREDLVIYLKFTMDRLTEFRVLSFKEK